MIAQTANQWSPSIYFIGASERSRHPRFGIPKNDAKAAGEAARQDVHAYLQDGNFEKAKHEKKSEAYKYAHDYPRHYVEQQ